MRRALPLLAALALAAPAAAQESRARLAARPPGRLAPQAADPRGLAARVMQDPAFAPLVHRQSSAWKDDLERSLREAQERARLRPLKLPSLPSAPSRPRLRPRPAAPKATWSPWPAISARIPWRLLRRLAEAAGMLLGAAGLAVACVMLAWLFLTLGLALFPRLAHLRRVRDGLGALLVALWRLLRRRRRAASAATLTGPATRSASGAAAESPSRRSPSDWKALARDLLAAGRGREAFRALYLAMLARLDRAGLIAYRPHRTNWQYAREIPAGPVRDAFGELCRIFDRVWYGAHPCRDTEFGRGDRLVDAVLAAEDGGRG